jgi:hypothetical protein
MTIHKFGWMIYNSFMNNSLRWDLDGIVIVIFMEGFRVILFYPNDLCQSLKDSNHEKAGDYK